MCVFVLSWGGGVCVQPIMPAAAAGIFSPPPPPPPAAAFSETSHSLSSESGAFLPFSLLIPFSAYSFTQHRPIGLPSSSAVMLHHPLDQQIKSH